MKSYIETFLQKMNAAEPHDSSRPYPYLLDSYNEIHQDQNDGSSQYHFCLIEHSHITDPNDPLVTEKTYQYYDRCLNYMNTHLYQFLNENLPIAPMQPIEIKSPVFSIFLNQDHDSLMIQQTDYCIYITFTYSGL